MSYLSGIFKLIMMKFDIHHLNCSLVNLIRRIIISDDQFRIQILIKEFDIIIASKNTSTSFLMNFSSKLSLLPIHYDYKRLILNVHKKDLNSFIDIKIIRTKPLDVTTEHIQH